MLLLFLWLFLWLLHNVEPLFFHQLHNRIHNSIKERLFSFQDILSKVQILLHQLKPFLAILIFYHCVHIEVVLSAVLN
jgi:hypothetical protein